jgi:thymidylate synthase ThyX
MIEVKLIANSKAPSGVKLTTFVLTYPRFIHAELMTHRVFSRNASSSRAIPVNKQIQMVIDNPAIPLAFTKNKAGMQGGEVLKGEEHEAAVKAWLEARDSAVIHAKVLADLEVHKQYANRVLEPFAHITVVLTSTDFSNWFALRYHEMAQPEICELAKQMWEIYSVSQPRLMLTGEWHLPFVDGAYYHFIEEYLKNGGDQNRFTFPGGKLGILVKMSVARCARVSYLNHEGKQPTVEEDLKLYDRLLGQLPIHASPAEHQAMAMADKEMRSGNFRGWLQYRKTLVHENIETFNGPEEK